MTFRDMPNVESVIDPVVSQYKELFDSFDFEKSGYISVETLRDLFNFVGLDSYIENVQNSNAGQEKEFQKINFDVFVSILSSIDPTDLLEEDMTHCVFREFDGDEDGFISVKDLKRLLSKIGENLSENVLQEMIKEADKDGDGKVSFNEFSQIIKISPSSRGTSNLNDTTDDQKLSTKLSGNTLTSEKRKVISSPKCKLPGYSPDKRTKSSSRRRSSYVLKIHEKAMEVRSLITVKRIMSKGSWN